MAINTETHRAIVGTDLANRGKQGKKRAKFKAAKRGNRR